MRGGFPVHVTRTLESLVGADAVEIAAESAVSEPANHDNDSEAREKQGEPIHDNGLPWPLNNLDLPPAPFDVPPPPPLDIPPPVQLTVPVGVSLGLPAIPLGLPLPPPPQLPPPPEVPLPPPPF